MNRSQRRKQSRSKSNVSRTGVTYLAIAGLAGGSIGLASPAHAATYESISCPDLLSDMASLDTTGGTLTADFTGDCDFTEGYIFDQASTIIGPTDGSLTFSFTGHRTQALENDIADGFTVMQNASLSISNVNFVRPPKPDGFTDYFFNYFIFGQPNGSVPITVSNSSFSSSPDDFVSAAIYAEGSLSISDSSFTNLKSSSGGAAVSAISGSSTNITNSTFTTNASLFQSSGGAIYANGSLTVIGSTFDSNSSEFGNGGAILSEGTLTVSTSTFEGNTANQGTGGAIYENSMAPSLVDIDNSTFVENSAFNGAAFSTFSEGSIISNSTFWNNGGSDSGSIASDFTYFFGNIMANESAGVKAISEGYESNIDLGANLYTDESVVFMDPISEGEGASKLVEFDDLKLSELALNTTQPVNAGATNTVAIGADSVARDYYSATSVGINPRGLNIPDGNEFDTRIASLDQRGVARQPSIARLDVGAYEAGETTETETTETETTDSETLADTGLEDAQTNYLGLVGLGLAAIFGGSVGLVRRRKKA